MKLSLSFYPNLSKADKRTGKIPIYMRLILDRKKAEQRLNVEALPNELQEWDTSFMRFRKKEHVANKTLSKLESRFNDFQYQAACSLPDYEVKQIRDILMGNNGPQKISVIQYIDKFFKASVENNTSISSGTKRNYKKSISHFKKFLAFRNLKNPQFKEINVALAMEFKDYLLASYPEIKKGPLKENSASDVVKKIRVIFERAFEEELIASNYFKKVKLSGRCPKRPWLDIHQIKQIMKLDLSDFGVQKIYRDLFLFSVYTGLSYADAVGLTYNDLSFRDDGEIKLLIKRRKTDIITEMFLPKQAIGIINQYKETSYAKITGKVLPGRSNKELNIQVKILAGMCNLPILLTVHVARHTFRQLLGEAGIIDVPVIKRMMGHSRASDIDNVYYVVTESKLLEAKNKFQELLNNIHHDGK